MSSSRDFNFERDFFCADLYARPVQTPAEIGEEIRRLTRDYEKTWKDGPNSFYYRRAIEEGRRKFKELTKKDFVD